MINSKYTIIGGCEHINLGEGAGEFPLVPLKAYNDAYDDLKKILNEQGARAVLDYKHRCMQKESALPPLRQTLILTIVQERDGKVHLLTADEADLNQNRELA